MRKLIRSRLLLIAALVAGSVGLTATPALAHHPDFSGKVDCVADQWVITWTILNSESTQGTDRTMTIDKVKLSASPSVNPLTINGLAKGDKFPPRPLEGSTKTATTILPGSYNGKVTLEITAGWNKGGPHDEKADQKVEVRGNCKTPEQPSATIEVSCADDGVKIVLTNSGGGQVNFNVKKGDPTIDTPKVGAGESITKIYPLAEGETATFSVKAEGKYETDKTVTRDCQKPAAAVNFSCADGLQATLSNTGGALPVTFTVKKGGAMVGTYEVGAEGSKVVDIPIAEDETATVSITAPDFAGVTETVTKNCQQPTALINSTCADGAVVTLGNTGQSPVEFTVKKNGSEVEKITVTGGTVGQVHKFTMDEDEEATFLVTAPGGLTDVSQVIKHDCQAPSATINQTCTDGAVVLLSNAGENPVDFAIKKDGQLLENVNVPGGTTDLQKTYALTEDESASFSVEALNMQTVVAALTQNCQIPSATLTQNCTDGVVATLTNAGQTAVTFTIKKGGTALDPVEVGPNESKEVRYALTEGEQATFEVTAPGGLDEAVSLQAEQDCLKPDAAINLTCADGLVVTLTNLGGDLPVEFTVTVDDQEEKVTVEPDGMVEKKYTVEEDSTPKVKVTDNDPKSPDTSATLVQDCVRPVTASLTQNCALGGVVALFSNEQGLGPVEFTVTKDGTEVGSYTVDPGKTLSSDLFPMAEDEKATFAVTGPNLASPASLDANLDCQKPAATLVANCDQGAVVTVGNSGELPVNFVVTRNGAPLETLTIGPGVKDTRTYPLEEDTTTTFTVAAPGITTLDATVEKDCDGGPGVEVGGVTTTDPGTEVLGVTVELPATTTVPHPTLPATGAGEAAGFWRTALGMVGLGLLLRRLGRRR